jgi:hypothetical protein
LRFNDRAGANTDWRQGCQIFLGIAYKNGK